MNGSRTMFRAAWTTFVYAIHEMSHQKLVFSVRVGATSLATFLLFLVVVAAETVLEERKSALEKCSPERISLLAPLATEPRPFSPAVLESLRLLPGVVAADGRVELGVEVALSGRRRALASMLDGIVVDPLPDRAASRMRNGRPLSIGDDLAAVMPLDLFERLGGSIDELDRLDPDRVTVTVSRTRDGVLEERAVELSILGLRAPANEARIDVPLQLAQEFDDWCLSVDAPQAPGEEPNEETSAIPFASYESIGDEFLFDGSVGEHFDAIVEDDLGSREDSTETVAPHFVRAQLIVADLDSLEGVVGELRRAGYQTVDSLADSQALEAMATTLTRIVAILVGSTLTLCFLLLLSTTALRIHSRLGEIGLLRAHGVGKTQIVLGYAVQGSMLGLIAVSIAAATTWALARPLASLAERALGIASDPSLWTASGSPALATMSAGVIVVLSTLAAVIPSAWYACRLSASAALRAET